MADPDPAIALVIDRPRNTGVPDTADRPRNTGVPDTADR